MQAPKQICLIDYQLSRYASPILDLMYFLFTSTVKSLRDECYETMMELYYDELSKHMRRLGSDPNEIFSRSDFASELQKFGRYGALIAPMMVQVVTADPTDIPDMDEVSENMAESTNEPKMMLSEKTIDSYNVRIGDVMRDAERYGFL